MYVDLFLLIDCLTKHPHLSIFLIDISNLFDLVRVTLFYVIFLITIFKKKNYTLQMQIYKRINYFAVRSHN